MAHIACIVTRCTDTGKLEVADAEDAGHSAGDVFASYDDGRAAILHAAAHFYLGRTTVGSIKKA